MMTTSTTSTFETGDVVHGQSCPKCRRLDAVLYNGNYFCSRCDWAMGEQARPKRIIIAYLQQAEIAAAKRGDEVTASRMRFHLREHGVTSDTVDPNPEATTRMI